MPFTRATAARLGRKGGLRSAEVRGVRGSAAWGRHMRAIKAARALHRHYPEHAREWGRNACRKAHGLPMLPSQLAPIPDDTLTPWGLKKRRRVALERRRQAYDAAGTRAAP